MTNEVADAAAAGTWLLLDPMDGRVLVTAREVFPDGRAPRRIFPAVLRQAVEHVLHTVAETTAPVRDTITLRGATYTRRGVPVLGPFGELRLVLVYLGEAGHTVPRPPALGAWQWDITRHVTTWSAEMRTLYRADGDGGAQWNARQYFGFLHPAATEYPRLQAWIADGEDAAPDERLSHLFRVRRGDGEHRIFRNFARVEREIPQAPTLRGVTVDITDISPVGMDDETLGPVVRAMESLSAPAVWLTLQPLWQTPTVIRASADPAALLGRPLPDSGRLRELVHPADVDTLQQQVADAPDAPFSWRPRVLQPDGDTRTLTASVTAQLPSPPGAVLCLVHG